MTIRLAPICALLATACAASACATAGDASQRNDVPADAPGGVDARTPGGSDVDAAIDAPVHVDAAIDAPSSLCASPFTGALASWTLTGEAGSQASTPAATTATGVVAGDLARAATLTAVSGASSLNSSNWPASAQLDAAKYVTFSVTAPHGCSLDITSVAIDVKSSGSGPASASLATSDDNFSKASAVMTAAPSTVTLGITGAIDAVEIHVYGYSASSASGTMRVQNTLTVSGSVH